MAAKNFYGKPFSSKVFLSKLFISVVLIFLSCGQLNFSYSQENFGGLGSSSRTNLEIMEQNISSELEKFFFYPDVNRELQFVFFVEPPNKDKDEKRFVESVIKKTAEKNNLRVSFAKDKQMQSTDSVYYKAPVEIVKLKTSYPKFGKNVFLGEKSLVREVSSDLNIEFSLSSGETVVKDKITTVYRGEIPYDDYGQFETEQYLFTQSVPPNISFLESIIFPAAIIVISAIATVLFFTIRSK